MAQNQGDQNFYIMEDAAAVNINRDNIHTMQKDLKKLSGVFIAGQAQQQFAPQIKQPTPNIVSQQPYQSQININGTKPQPGPQNAPNNLNVKINAPKQPEPQPKKKEEVVILEAYEIAAPPPEEGIQTPGVTTAPRNIPIQTTPPKTQAPQNTAASDIQSTIAEEFLYHHPENKPQPSKPKVISEPVFPKQPNAEAKAPGTLIQQSKMLSDKGEPFGQETITKNREMAAPVPELEEIDQEQIKNGKKLIEPIEIPGLQKTEQALEKMGQTIKEKAQEIIKEVAKPQPPVPSEPKIISQAQTPAAPTKSKPETPKAETKLPEPQPQPKVEIKAPVPEIKAPTPENPKDEVPRPANLEAAAPPKESIQKNLTNLGKQKALIGAEKDLMMRGLELKASELKKGKDLLLKANKELLDKREDIEDAKLAVAMKAENDIEKELAAIVQKTRHAKDVAEQEKLEQERNAKEQERQEAEKARWKVEDEILQIIDEIENNKEKFDELAAAEEKINEEKTELSHREETIAFEEERLKAELELLNINEQQETLAGQYSELLPEKSLLSKALNEATLKKIKSEERIVSLELKEKAAQGLERRDIEVQRQQAEQLRKEMAQAALKKLKDKERVEHEIDRIAKLMQSLNIKEKELKNKIKSLQDKINQIRK